MSAAFSLEGRTALITGSTRGIGLAMARTFAEAGARIALHGRTRSGEAEAALVSVQAVAGTCQLYSGGLGEPGAARALVASVAADIAAPDIVVHCASLETRRPWAEIGWPEAEQQLRVNLWAGVELFQAAVPAMRQQGWGRLLAVGSVQQVKPHPDMLIYAASKCALGSVVRSLAHQLARTGITANTLAPGAIHTDRTAPVLSDDAYAAKVTDSIPLGFIGEPADCVGAALLLASEAGRYISGETLFVDGLKNF